MTKTTLYRYEREDGGITVTTEKPNVPHTTLFRLIADDGKMVTLDGVDMRAAVDVDSVDGWHEVDAEETLCLDTL